MHPGLQPAIGAILLRRARENRLQAHMLCAAAQAARQCAKEVQEDAHHYSPLACAACAALRNLMTQLHSS